MDMPTKSPLHAMGQMGKKMTFGSLASPRSQVPLLSVHKGLLNACSEADTLMGTEVLKAVRPNPLFWVFHGLVGKSDAICAAMEHGHSC